jgi:nucleoside-diphosphate-sugar epimerase
MIDLEVRGAINVVEACAQTDTIEKIIFSSSLTAAIWRENICSQEDVDERSWSDQEFCRKLKVWTPETIFCPGSWVPSLLIMLYAMNTLIMMLFSFLSSTSEHLEIVKDHFCN